MGPLSNRQHRERLALSLACLLHAAVVCALWYWAPAERKLPVLESSQLAPHEIELTLEPPPASLPRPAPDLLAPTVSRSSARATMPPRSRFPDQAGDRTAPAEITDSTDGTDGTNGTSPAEPRAQRSAAPEGVANPIDLGFGNDAWRTWIRTPEGTAARTGSTAGPRRAPRPASSTGGLQEGLEEHDRQLGLGTSGPVVSALYRAAHDPLAPEAGTAHFRVTVLNSGTVEISLSDATSQLAAWQAVAAKAAEALQRTPPRIPKPRSGARMLIEVSAEQLFPNGVKPKDLHGPRLEVQAPRLRSVSAAQANLKELNPVAGQNGAPSAETKANVDLPGVFVAGKGKVCSYRVGLTPLGPLLQGGCDLVNVGAKSQRMVHTRVREETLF